MFPKSPSSIYLGGFHKKNPSISSLNWTKSSIIKIIQMIDIREYLLA